MYSNVYVNPNLSIYPFPSFPCGKCKFAFYIWFYKTDSISVLYISSFISFY